MKRIFFIALAVAVVALCGCSREKAPDATQKIPAFTLSPGEMLSTARNIQELRNSIPGPLKISKRS
jgi:ABC-type phosphate/phosphonate transport system substrate-binding protein